MANIIAMSDGESSSTTSAGIDEVDTSSPCIEITDIDVQQRFLIRAQKWRRAALTAAKAEIMRKLALLDCLMFLLTYVVIKEPPAGSGRVRPLISRNDVLNLAVQFMYPEHRVLNQRLMKIWDNNIVPLFGGLAERFRAGAEIVLRSPVHVQNLVSEFRTLYEVATHIDCKIWDRFSESEDFSSMDTLYDMGLKLTELVLESTGEVVRNPYESLKKKRITKATESSTSKKAKSSRSGKEEARSGKTVPSSASDDVTSDGTILTPKVRQAKINAAEKVEKQKEVFREVSRVLRSSESRIDPQLALDAKEDKEYEIDEIKNVRNGPRNIPQYLVSFVGYPASSDMWLPITQLKKGSGKIQEFYDRVEREGLDAIHRRATLRAIGNPIHFLTSRSTGLVSGHRERMSAESSMMSGSDSSSTVVNEPLTFVGNVADEASLQVAQAPEQAVDALAETVDAPVNAVDAPVQAVLSQAEAVAVEVPSAEAPAEVALTLVELARAPVEAVEAAVETVVPPVHAVDGPVETVSTSVEAVVAPVEAACSSVHAVEHSVDTVQVQPSEESSATVKGNMRQVFFPEKEVLLKLQDEDMDRLFELLSRGECENVVKLLFNRKYKM